MICTGIKPKESNTKNLNGEQIYKNDRWTIKPTAKQFGGWTDKVSSSILINVLQNLELKIIIVALYSMWMSFNQ